MKLKKSPKAVLATLTILASSFAGVNLLPGTASAFCNGKYHPFPFKSNYYGVTERNRLAGTCDGLNDYYGEYIDSKTDGAAVYIRYQRNGVWTNTPVSGSETQWRRYSYTDKNSDSDSRMCNNRKGCSKYRVYHAGF